MSPQAWRTPTAVIARLLQAPQQFGFFQALRLLDNWAGLERVQCHNSVSLSFPASEIESLQAHWTTPQTVGLSADAVERIDLTPACMGLLGVSGALPLYYTEWLAQAELKGRNGAARAFLDVFSHRSMILFYQAWRKHRMGVRYEQEAAAPRALLAEVLALSGVGLKGMRHRLGAEQGGVSDEALAYFAGILQQRMLPMAQLQRLLTRYLGVEVSMEPFVGRWYPVPRSGRTALGGAGSLGSHGSTGVLGRSALLGERVWQRNLCVRVVLGPLDRTEFLRCLPGGAGAQALRQWLGLLLGPALDVEVRLRLRREAVNGITLEANRTPLSGRLGWDTFLLTGEVHADRQDVHYDIHCGEPTGASPSTSPSSLSMAFA